MALALKDGCLLSAALLPFTMDHAEWHQQGISDGKRCQSHMETIRFFIQTTKDGKMQKHFGANSVFAVIMIVKWLELLIDKTMKKRISSNKISSEHLKSVTCDLGGDGYAHRGAKALNGGSFDGEDVGGSRIETLEHVTGLITQLEDVPPLVGHISAGVGRAQGIVGNLQECQWEADGTSCISSNNNCCFKLFVLSSKCWYHWATGWKLGKWVRLQPVSCYIPNEHISACSVLLFYPQHKGCITWTQALCESEEHLEQRSGVECTLKSTFLWTFSIQSYPCLPNVTKKRCGQPLVAAALPVCLFTSIVAKAAGLLQ